VESRWSFLGFVGAEEAAEMDLRLGSDRWKDMPHGLKPIDFVEFIGMTELMSFYKDCVL
jgi:hypothetical protein